MAVSNTELSMTNKIALSHSAIQTSSEVNSSPNPARYVYEYHLLSYIVCMSSACASLLSVMAFATPAVSNTFLPMEN